MNLKRRALRGLRVIGPPSPPHTTMISKKTATGSYHSIRKYVYGIRPTKGKEVIAMAKVPVNTKVEAGMKAKMELIGRKSSLSYADVVRMALFEYIGKFEKSNGKIHPEEINQIVMFGNK